MAIPVAEEVTVLEMEEGRTLTVTKNKKHVVDVSDQVFGKRSRLSSEYIILYLHG